MKALKFLLAAATVAATLAAGIPFAAAVSPSYSVSLDKSGSGLWLNVSNASSYSQVDFYGRQGSQLWTTVTNVGRTDGFGSFSGSVTPGFSYGSSIESYIVVNGQSSRVVTWSNPSYGIDPDRVDYCYYYNYSCTDYLSVSEGTVNMRTGDSRTVIVHSRTNQRLVVGTQPNNNVAEVSLSGSELTIYGVGRGSTQAKVCTWGREQCVAITINITGLSSGRNRITFSPENVTMQRNENRAVAVRVNDDFVSDYYGGPRLYISSNSNNSAVSASISGNTLYLYGQRTGRSSIEVCSQTFVVSCGTLRVVVSSNSGSRDEIRFFPDRLSLRSGDTETVTGFRNGFETPLYLSRNTNPDIASVKIRGNDVTVYARRSGTTTLTLCAEDNRNSCGTLTVAVSRVGRQ
jgi:hypothetical protein